MAQSEQEAFREEVRSFLAANAKPRQDKSPWAVNFHTDPEGARQEFESGRAWQQKLFANKLTAFTYPEEYGGRGGQPWMETIYKELTSNTIANSHYVSAGIVATNRAQERGSTLAHCG